MLGLLLLLLLLSLLLLLHLQLVVLLVAFCGVVIIERSQEKLAVVELKRNGTVHYQAVKRRHGGKKNYMLRACFVRVD